MVSYTRLPISSHLFPCKHTFFFLLFAQSFSSLFLIWVCFLFTLFDQDFGITNFALPSSSCRRQSFCHDPWDGALVFLVLKKIVISNLFDWFTYGRSAKRCIACEWQQSSASAGTTSKKKVAPLALTQIFFKKSLWLFSNQFYCFCFFYQNNKKTFFSIIKLFFLWVWQDIKKFQ